jgi:acylphosphatase
MTVIRRISVRGRVQGVGFRAFVEHEALKHHVGGWVRNRSDGTVEAVFSGEAAAVAAAVEACRRGPMGSRVEAFYDEEGSDADLKLVRAGDVFSVLPDA